jgi:hypothetical protein
MRACRPAELTIPIDLQRRTGRCPPARCRPEARPRRHSRQTRRRRGAAPAGEGRRGRRRGSAARSSHRTAACGCGRGGVGVRDPGAAQEVAHLARHVPDARDGGARARRRRARRQGPRRRAQLPGDGHGAAAPGLGLAEPSLLAAASAGSFAAAATSAGEQQDEELDAIVELPRRDDDVRGCVVVRVPRRCAGVVVRPDVDRRRRRLRGGGGSTRRPARVRWRPRLCDLGPIGWCHVWNL